SRAWTVSGVGAEVTFCHASPPAASPESGAPSTRNWICMSWMPSEASSRAAVTPLSIGCRYNERPPRPLSATNQRAACSFTAIDLGPYSLKVPLVVHSTGKPKPFVQLPGPLDTLPVLWTMVTLSELTLVAWKIEAWP